jgi:uncharacterized membrane protein YfcA
MKMAELGLSLIAGLVVFAFLCEYVDSTLGMGYGTTLTPVFLIMGLSPREIVPAVLLSELVSGILAAVLHHREGNVNFKVNGSELMKVAKRLNLLGYIEGFRKNTSPHFRIAMLLAACSIIGTVAAVFVAVNIPKFWLKMYIGVLVLTMGILVLLTLKRQMRFSWKKVGLLGLVASFNKGMSGGGYGPVVTSGQLLSGVEGKNAVAITSLAEGLTCLVGVITYLLVASESINWRIAPFIVIGAVLSVPLSAKSVKWLSTKVLKLAIAVLTILLGSYTIYNTVTG